MSGHAIQAVVFDLDDTLFAERDYVRSGYRAVAAHLTDDAERAAKIADWMWDRFCDGRADRMFNAAAEHFGLAGSDEHISELIACYRDHEPDIAPIPEALDVLNALGGRVKLGVISDGFLPAQQLKFDALGLADSFDAVLFTESIGREFWKPSPVAFERIAAELGVPHTSCCYIGDNPTKDFVAPNALGWLTLQWRRPGQVHASEPIAEGGQPQVTVSGTAQLLSTLLGLLP